MIVLWIAATGLHVRHVQVGSQGKLGGQAHVPDVEGV